MSIQSKLTTFIEDPTILARKLMTKPFARIIPDEMALNIQFKLLLNKKLHLSPPVTFNEKIQWLKLHDRNPLYTRLADKYEAKNIIAEMIGEDYIIPTIQGPYHSFEEIDFDLLPNRFVIKCTHDSAGLVICREKNTIDYERAKTKINGSLKRNFYWRYREWVYKNIEPRVIVEKYMEDTSGDQINKSLTDYKFFTFNGDPKFLYISEGLENHDTAKISFFDLKGNLMPFKRLDYNGYSVAPKMPSKLDEMITIAGTLAKKIGAPFLRVDLYQINGAVYFSEVTFYPHAGFIPFEPEIYDQKLGEMIRLMK